MAFFETVTFLVSDISGIFTIRTIIDRFQIISRKTTGSLKAPACWRVNGKLFFKENCF